MLLSITVYTLFALSLFLLGWHVNRREQASLTAGTTKELPFHSWEILLCIGIIAIIFGIRFNTGSDYMMYWKQYYHRLHGLSYRREGGMEIGYEWITNAFAYLRCHYIVYFASWAGVQAFLIYYGLRHRKYLLPWMGLLLVLGPYSINWFSFMRQWIVTCAFIPMISLIQERRAVPYVLSVLLLSTIHLSAFVLLVFYFLPYRKISELSRKKCLIFMAMAILLGLKPFWIQLLKPFGDILPLFGYERYQVMFNELIDGETRFVSWGLLHTIIAFSQVVIIYYYKEVKAFRPNDLLLPLFFVLSFIAICYESLMQNTIHFLLRPVELLYGCELVMLAYTYNFLYAKKRYKELLVCLLPVILYVLINVVKSHHNPAGDMSEIVNYHFYAFNRIG